MLFKRWFTPSYINTTIPNVESTPTNPTNDNLATTPYNGLPSNSIDVINGLTDKNLQNEYLYNYFGVVDQRNFAERMARNSYQYAVEDMRNAGLNPYLLYTNGGSGAVVPSTNSYSSTGYASALQNASATKFKAQLDHDASKYTANLNYTASKYKTDKEFEASLIRSFSNVIGTLGKAFTAK